MINKKLTETLWAYVPKGTAKKLANKYKKDYPRHTKTPVSQVVSKIIMNDLSK